jgi:hypothetical protein
MPNTFEMSAQPGLFSEMRHKHNELIQSKFDCFSIKGDRQEYTAEFFTLPDNDFIGSISSDNYFAMKTQAKQISLSIFSC